MNEPLDESAHLKIDNHPVYYVYTKDELERTIEGCITKTVLPLLAHANLDNGIITIQHRNDSKGEETSMPSTHRETYTYIDETGIPHTVRLQGCSKADTDRRFQQFLFGQKEKKESPILRDFVNNVFRPSFIAPLSESTKANYEMYLKLNILPFMGDMRMGDVTVATIQQFYDWMATGASHGRKKNINRRTIERVSGFASRIFSVAQEMKLIDDTPFKMKLLRNSGEQAGHHKALPDDEVLRVKLAIPTLQDERQRLYMGLLAYTGMRREEILGLRWECINLQEGYGLIKTVVIYPGRKQTVVKDRPKTNASQRTFLIPKPLMDLLLPCAKPSGFVIHGKSQDEPVSCATAQRTYTKAFEALGIKGYDNHDWRATFGTQLKEAGMTSAQVADLMGHADTRMVENTYARTRHEGVMKHKYALEALNAQCAVDTFGTPKTAPQPV